MAEEKRIEEGLPETEADSENCNVSKQHFWTGEVDVKRGDLLLLACCFTTGLLDCSTFHNWVVFVSMQTGE